MKKILAFLFASFLTTSLIAQFSFENYKNVEDDIFYPELVLFNSVNNHIFEAETPLNVTLSFDIESFMRYKRKEEFQNALLKIYFNNGDSISKNIRIKARGNFRKDHCSFPPMNLYFNSDPEEDLGLQNKIKLVTHCRDSKIYNNYVLKEYLLYKMYNILTENSFKVRLLNILYIDTGSTKRKYRHSGFFIEPIKQLTQRTETIEVEPRIIRSRNLYESDADRIALFQYMIGNTDWKVSDGHNLKFIKPINEFTLKLIPVPYDFDFSGFVNTQYAIPQEWTSIESVRIREYLGYCRDNDEAYLNNINYFLEKENEILSVLEDFNQLSEKQIKALNKYLIAFFKELKKTKYIVRVLKDECRGEF